ncbi:MAG: redoxin domain-containing protein [Planctomycetes bacterium]|nr:redoxin domain-containing protein [Planctomycetota bacterium]
MLPHEKALVERQKNKPFALIGINTDAPETFRERAPKEGVTWRNVLEGRSGGAIVRDWGVHAFPTIYVLDAKGIVRFTGVRDEAMDRAVETLLAELEHDSKPAEKR